jgi:hypothetical protein
MTRADPNLTVAAIGAMRRDCPPLAPSHGCRIYPRRTMDLSVAESAHAVRTLAG